MNKGDRDFEVCTDYRELFASLKKRPTMYGLDGAYRTMVAFVEGCDYVTQRGLLAGFKEWLVVKLRDGKSLAWPALVLKIAFPDDSPSYHGVLSPEENDAAVDCLFRLLDEFLCRASVLRWLVPDLSPLLRLS